MLPNLETFKEQIRNWIIEKIGKYKLAVYNAGYKDKVVRIIFSYILKLGEYTNNNRIKN